MQFLSKSCRFIDESVNSGGISLESKLSTFKRFNKVPPFVSCFSIVVLTAVVADPDRSDFYSIGFMGNILTLSLAFEMITLFTFPVFIKEMSNLLATQPDAPESAKIKQIHFYFSIVHWLMIFFLIFMDPLLVVFMSWSFLRRKCTYLIWITLLSAQTISVLVCVTFVSYEKLARVIPSAAIAMPESVQQARIYVKSGGK